MVTKSVKGNPVSMLLRTYTNNRARGTPQQVSG